MTGRLWRPYRKMMVNIHKVPAEAAEEYGLGYSLVAGADSPALRRLLPP